MSCSHLRTAALVVAAQAALAHPSVYMVVVFCMMLTTLWFVVVAAQETSVGLRPQHRPSLFLDIVRQDRLYSRGGDQVSHRIGLLSDEVRKGRLGATIEPECSP